MHCIALALGLWLGVQPCMLAATGRHCIVHCSALYAGQAVLVYGIAPKVASLGSWDMYSLARRGRVMGLQCITLFILKHLQSASYKASGICHGSSYSTCGVYLCCLCSLCSLVRDTL